MKRYQTVLATQSQAFFNIDNATDFWTVLTARKLGNKSTLYKELRYEMATGLHARMNQLHNFGKDLAKYPIGLPNSSLSTNLAGESEMRAHLETLHPAPVSILYHWRDTLNPLHEIYRQLISQYGLIPSTGELKTLSETTGLPVYLEHIEIRLPTEIATETATQTISAAKLDDIEQDMLWELPPAIGVQRQFDNPFNGVSILTDNGSQPAEIICHLAHLATWPRSGTATYIDWETNGVPESVNPIATLSPETVDPEILELAREQLKNYGYSFDFHYGSSGADIDDFVVRSTLVLDSPDNLEDSGDWLQTKYQYSDADGAHIGYFSYEMGSEGIPALEAINTTADETYKFYPWIFFRSDGINLASPAEQETPEYLARKAICKKLDIDYESFAEQVNTNPDIDGIRQIYMSFGVPLTTNKQVGLKYLFLFFSTIATNDPLKDSFLSANRNLANMKVRLSLADRDAEQVIEMKQITESLKEGTLEDLRTDNKGPYSSELTSEEFRQEVYVKVPDSSASDPTYSYRYRWRTMSFNVMYLRYQVTETRYREIRIVDPVVLYKVKRGDSIRWVASTNYPDEYEDDNPDGQAEEAVGSTHSFIVPLSHTIVKEHFAVLKQQELYKLSAHITYNTYDRIKLKWYQRGPFKLVLIVIMVVVIIKTAGAATQQVAALWAFIYAATGSVIAATILTAIVYVGWQKLVDVIFKLIVKELGAENAAILAAIAVLASVTGTAVDLPDADLMLEASLYLTNATEYQTGVELEELQQEFAEHREDLEEKMVDLEEHHKEYLERTQRAENFALMRNNLPPEQFYELLIHTGNPGVAMYDYFHQYYDQLLRLPTAEETLFAESAASSDFLTDIG